MKLKLCFGSAQGGHVDLALTRAVELAEEDRLVAAKCQLALLERNEHLGAHEGCTHVGRRIRPVGIVVLPAPAILDDPLQRPLDVVRESRIDVLIDGHPGRRVRHVNECRGSPVDPVQSRLDLLRDVEQLRAPLGTKADLPHRGILRAVPSETPTSPVELDAYRAEADRFIAELDEEYYLHYAGLKDRLELEEIYERHSVLTELERVQALGASVNGDRRLRELWHFGCEGYLGKLTREDAERLAAIEAE